MDFYILLRIVVKILLVNLVKSFWIEQKKLLQMILRIRLKEQLKKTPKKTAEATGHLIGNKIADKISGYCASQNASDKPKQTELKYCEFDQKCKKYQKEDRYY